MVYFRLFLHYGSWEGSLLGVIVELLFFAMLHLLQLHLKILLEVFAFLLNDLSLHLGVLQSPGMATLYDALCPSLLFLEFHFTTTLLKLGMHVALALLGDGAVLLSHKFHLQLLLLPL